MDLVNFKNTLKSKQNESDLTHYISDQIRTIDNHQSLRGDLELSHYLLNNIEANYMINNKGKTENTEKELKEKRILFHSIITNIFPDTTHIDTLNYDKHIDFFRDNDLIARPTQSQIDWYNFKKMFRKVFSRQR